MGNQEMEQLKKWVTLKEQSRIQNEDLFKGEEKGYPLYLTFEGTSTPFYLYTTQKDGKHSVYYGIADELIELQFTPYDFQDEKRMLMQLMEKRAKQAKTNAQ